MAAFVTTQRLMADLQRSVLGGAKIPHSVSYPVLRKEGEDWRLAVYVLTYDRELLRKQALRRPSCWYLADLLTGEVLREVDCREEDFCTAPFDRLLKRGEPKNPDLSRADVENMYALLDQIRTRILESGVPDALAYREYLDQVLHAVPAGEVNFYRELSSLK